MMTQTSQTVLHVAIGLIFQHAKVLLGWRHAEQHQGNKYEFPGGKVEQGETPMAACRREVREEVGVDLEDWHEFDVIHHHYPDLELYLHVFHTHISPELNLSIHAGWTWYKRPQLRDLKFPAANQSIIDRLYWPQKIKIAQDLASVQQALEDDLIYWRMEAATFDAAQLCQLSRAQLQRVILNIDVYKMLDASECEQIKTVHFKQHQLMALKSGDLVHGRRCIAACHDLAAVSHAQFVGMDAIFLSPVQATASHPDATALGWETFAHYAAQCHIPVFALGGVKPNDLALAQHHHGYGVAGIRSF